MTSFSASLINFPALLLPSRDSSYHVASDVSIIWARKRPQHTPAPLWLQNTMIYAYTTSRILPTCNTSLGSLTGAMPEAGDFVESRRLYFMDAPWSSSAKIIPGSLNESDLFFRAAAQCRIWLTMRAFRKMWQTALRSVATLWALSYC